VAITPQTHLPHQRHRQPPTRRHPIRTNNLACGSRPNGGRKTQIG